MPPVESGDQTSGWPCPPRPPAPPGPAPDRQASRGQACKGAWLVTAEEEGGLSRGGGGRASCHQHHWPQHPALEGISQVSGPSHTHHI